MTLKPVLIEVNGKEALLEYQAKWRAAGRAAACDEVARLYRIEHHWWWRLGLALSRLAVRKQGRRK